MFKNILGLPIVITKEELENKESRINAIIKYSKKDDNVYSFELKGEVANKYVDSNYDIDECQDFWEEVLNISKDYYDENYSIQMLPNSICLEFEGEYYFTIPNNTIIVDFEKGTLESKYKCINYKNTIPKYIKNEDLQITKISINNTAIGGAFRVGIIDNSNGKELTGHSSDMIKFIKDFKNSFTNDLTCFMYFGEEKGNIKESKTFDKNYFMPGEIMVNEELEERANGFESDEDIVSLSLCGDIVLNISSYNKNEILKDNIKGENEEAIYLINPIQISTNRLLNIETSIEEGNKPKEIEGAFKDDCNTITYFVDKIYKDNIKDDVIIIEILSKFRTDWGEDYGFYY